MAQYTNKRNRFIYKVLEICLADPSIPRDALPKAQLTEVAQSIGMKGIPSWVLKEHKSATKGCYDLKALLDGGTVVAATASIAGTVPTVVNIGTVRCGSIGYSPSDQQNDPSTPLTDAP